MRIDRTVRTAGLVLTGTLVVHELRYLIAPAETAGHGYLPLLGVLSVAALAVAAGRLATLVERARSGAGEGGAGLPFGVAWAGLAVMIALAFTVQELLEGVVAGGGAGAVATSGGGVAYPLAVVVAAVLALGIGSARAAVRAVARRVRPAAPRRRPGTRRAPRWAARWPSRPLALKRAGRAPPLAV